MDYGNQLANLIVEYLPYTTEKDIGSKFQCSFFTASSTEMVMTFSAGNYADIISIITDSLNPNSTFTVAGFYLKNVVNKFKAYPEGSTFYYGFEVGFSRPHKYTKDDIFTTKDFTNPIYNISYKVLRVIDAYNVVVYPTTSVTIATITTGLGQVPTSYMAGLNGIKTLVNEATNQISFALDATEMFTAISNSDIDTSYLPYVYYYNDAVKVIDFKTFLSNLTDRSNEKYLIIDTTSLKGSPARSKNNNSDSPYQSYGRFAAFDKNYTMNLMLVLQRYVDDSTNQTTSGSDIMTSQITMHDALVKISSQSFDDETGKSITTMKILNDYVSDNTSEGRTIITYEVGFSVNFDQDILIKKDDKNTYPIDSVKINTDVVDFS